jgi:uncharacterized membrane protein
MTLNKIRRFLLLSHTSTASRYWEIDALRGVAIVMMVIYHLVYDLALFGYYEANVLVGPWRVFARATASLFILLAGISLAISRARIRRLVSGWELYRNYLTRGLKLVGWGMIITLVTWVYTGKVVVIFGILHLIGVSIALAYPFLSLGRANLLIGAAIIALGTRVGQLKVTHSWLLLLGLRPPTLFQLDYFPLLPWFGVVLVGIFIGQSLYPDSVRRFNIPSGNSWPGIRELVWLGHRSLAIYLVHQPLLFAFLTLAGVLSMREVIQ